MQDTRVCAAGDRLGDRPIELDGAVAVEQLEQPAGLAPEVLAVERPACARCHPGADGLCSSAEYRAADGARVDDGRDA
jgi:hypothetical protein